MLPRRSQVLILSALPGKTALGELSGGRFHWLWERNGICGCSMAAVHFRAPAQYRDQGKCLMSQYEAVL